VDNKLRGSAGEYLVCGALPQLGWAAALTRDGLARTDVLAVNTVTGRTITIQVKTTGGKAARLAKWRVGCKDILPAAGASEWYVMVKLEGTAPAQCRYFVVPRDHMAAAVWIVHQEWLTDPTVKPGKRNTPISLANVGELPFIRYEDRWDLLDTPTDEVPVLLSAWCRQMALEKRVGLPPDHPWREHLPEWS
jgi:hypothetical protein